MAEPVLLIEGVRRSFGGVVALDLDRLAVAPGQAVGVIGPNGAGKTSLLDVVSGFVAPDAGRWLVDGVEVGGWPTERIARAGLVRTFQRARVLPELSVLDNLRAAAPHQRGIRPLVALSPRTWRTREAEVTEAAHQRLARLGLDRHAAEPAGHLSAGEQKLLDLGRALMAEPRVLLLDEPLAGVSPTRRDVLAERLADLRARGTALLIVEHDLRLVQELCDEAVCLDRGVAIASGAPEQVVHDPAVVDASLGRSVS